MRRISWIAMSAFVLAMLVACAPAAPAPTTPPAKPTDAPKPAAQLTAAPAKPVEAPAAKPPEAKPAEKSADKTGLTPAAQQLIAAAREKGENQLDISWGANSIGGPEGAKKFEELFNRLYGTSIKINFTPGPSQPDMAAKVTQELAAGRPASTDILAGSEDTLSPVVDTLESYDYAQLSPRIIPEIVAYKNVGLVIYENITVIAYNTNLVPPSDAPKKLEDVLDPKWKGKIAATVTASSFDRVAQHPAWGADRMRTFVTRLAQQAGGLIRVGELARVGSGEFDMQVFNNYHGVLQLKAQGAPVASVIPEDAAIYGVSHFAAPRNSAHPNLAKLFVALSASEEGQKLLFEYEKTDNSSLPGTQSTAMRDLRSRGGQILKVDIGYFLAHPEMAGLREEFTAILAKKG